MNQSGDQGGTPGKFLDTGQGIPKQHSYGIALGDLDGDGDIDVSAAGTGASPSIVWVNQSRARGDTEGLFLINRPWCGRTRPILRSLTPRRRRSRPTSAARRGTTAGTSAIALSDVASTAWDVDGDGYDDGDPWDKEAGGGIVYDNKMGKSDDS